VCVCVCVCTCVCVCVCVYVCVCARTCVCVVKSLPTGGADSGAATLNATLLIFLKSQRFSDCMEWLRLVGSLKL